MNKIFLYFFVFLLGISLVFAAAEDVVTGANPDRSGTNSPEDSGNLESGSDNENGSQEGNLVATQTAE